MPTRQPVDSTATPSPTAQDGTGLNLRLVDLEGQATGRLLLAAIPGRGRDLAADMAQISAQSVSRILCLVEADELRRLSPDYADFCDTADDARPAVTHHPISDLDIPRDLERYRSVTNQTAEHLKAGETVLVHCAAGIGRTGMTAIAVLCALGLDGDAARQRVAKAGAGPETPEQKAFLRELVGTC